MASPRQAATDLLVAAEDGRLEALVDLLHCDSIDLLDLSSAGLWARSQALGEGIPLYRDEAGVYAAAHLRTVPLAMELGWLIDLDLALLAER